MAGAVQLGPVDHDFVYPPLEDPSKQIRLLQFGPRSGDSINCFMTVHSLDAVQNMYTAVSYTWGDSIELKELKINEHLFLLTRNGEFALRQVRWHQTCPYTWIDAVCIDQSNDEERGHQVRNMGRIYSGAKNVAASIGLSDPITSAQSHGLIGVTSEDAKAYFSRMWIVQELVLSRKVLLMKGGQCEDADAVVERYDMSIKRICPRAMEPGFRRPPMLGPTPKHIALLRRDCFYKRDIHDYRTYHSLADDIVLYSGGACRDPRDQVYSLVGIANRFADFSHLAAPPFPVSYRKSLLEVLLDFVLHLSRRDRLQTAFKAIMILIDLFHIDWMNSQVRGKLSMELDRARAEHSPEQPVKACSLESFSEGSKNIATTAETSRLRLNNTYMSYVTNNLPSYDPSLRASKREISEIFDCLDVRPVLREDCDAIRVNKPTALRLLSDPCQCTLIPKRHRQYSSRLFQVENFTEAYYRRGELFVHPLDLFLGALCKRYDMGPMEPSRTGVSFAIFSGSRHEQTQ